MWSGTTLIGAAMTVRRAPWDDTPDCPFVIELFTDVEHRRRGVASMLMTSVALAASGEHAHLALRVGAHNTGAIALYRTLGFAPWRVPECVPLRR